MKLDLINGKLVDIDERTVSNDFMYWTNKQVVSAGGSNWHTINFDNFKGGINFEEIGQQKAELKPIEESELINISFTQRMELVKRAKTANYLEKRKPQPRKYLK